MYPDEMGLDLSGKENGGTELMWTVPFLTQGLYLALLEPRTSQLCSLMETRQGLVPRACGFTCFL